MDAAPIWARVLYSAVIAWIAVVVGRNIFPAVWRRSGGSWWNRAFTIALILFITVFMAAALFCAITGRITVTRHRG